MGVIDSQRGRRRVGRRTLLRGVGTGAAGLAGAALLGCGSDEAQTPGPATSAPPAGGTGQATATQAAAQPKRGGRLRDAVTNALTGMDMHINYGAGLGMTMRIYPYLIRMSLFDGAEFNGQVFPDLAESWEILPDGVTYVFKLRPNAVIGPNKYGYEERAMTAEDVVANFDRIRDPANGANGYRFAGPRIAQYDAPDDHTFRVVTDGVYGWTLAELGDDKNAMLAPRELLERGQLAAEAAGAGPYRIIEADEERGYLLGRNPHYYDPELPYVEEYEATRMSDDVTLRTAFEGGELDAYAPNNVEERDALIKAYPGLQSFEFSTTSANYLLMQTQLAPWQDDRARKAIHLGVNPQEFIDILLAGRGRIVGANHPAFEGYALPAEEVEQLRSFQPAEAAKLFQAAGVTQFDLYIPSRQVYGDNANIFVRQMQKLGVAVKADTSDWASWLSRFYNNQLPMIYTPRTLSNTPDFFMGHNRTGASGGNDTYSSFWSDPTYDRMLNEAAAVLDKDERKSAYQEAERYILPLPHGVMYFYDRGYFALRGKRVRNYRPAPMLNTYINREMWIDEEA